MFIHEIEDEQDAINFCIQGVENNNDMNGAWWSDWDDADFLIAVQTVPPKIARHFLSQMPILLKFHFEQSWSPLCVVTVQSHSDSEQKIAKSPKIDDKIADFT